MENFDEYIDSLIDSGALDDNDKLLSLVDNLPEADKLKVMDEIEAIRKETDNIDFANAVDNNDLDSVDNLADKAAYNQTGNEITKQVEIDKDNDGDSDITITKQDDGNDNDKEPANEYIENSSEEADEPSDAEVKDFMQKALDNFGKRDGNTSLNSNVVNAVAGHRF